MANDGGPAFPVECSYTGDGKIVGLQTSAAGGWETGMSLRDFFAAQAMSEFIRLLYMIPDRFENDTHTASVAAHKAYAMADAMIAARPPQESAT
jgi:hypothetical protein